jgi:hypothetical protein
MRIANLTPAKVSGMSRPRRVLGMLALVMLLLGIGYAQSSTAGEYQVKAAFLYNFAKFVEWPASSFRDGTAPFQICVMGRDPFGEGLLNITREKTVNGRRLEVDTVADLEHARSCHILFVASSAKMPMQQIIEGLRGASVLTVGDTKGFAEQGGMIDFVLQDDRVQFDVSRTAVEQAGLKISSKLLSVAKVVR